MRWQRLDTDPEASSGVPSPSELQPEEALEGGITTHSLLKLNSHTRQGSRSSIALHPTMQRDF